MVTILMVYASGVPEMLKVTLKSLARHNAGHPYKLHIVVDETDSNAVAEASPMCGDAKVLSYGIRKSKTQSGQHAMLLDRAMGDVDTGLIMTLDSDCFPVADGWLKVLVDMMVEDVATTGILWPWKPKVPEKGEEKCLHWPIVNRQCWSNPQIACQLFRTRMIVDGGWKFADTSGEDTGYGILDKARASGLRTLGLLPTRGPLPDDPSTDPELNRLESVIYADLVYHHVGATREKRGVMPNRSIEFQSSRRKVIEMEGAEWMLQPGASHQYQFTREKDVTEFKIENIYRNMVCFLENHSLVFVRDWA